MFRQKDGRVAATLQVIAALVVPETATLQSRKRDSFPQGKQLGILSRKLLELNLLWYQILNAKSALLIFFIGFEVSFEPLYV